jgi:hypothetical protein
MTASKVPLANSMDVEKSNGSDIVVAPGGRKKFDHSKSILETRTDPFAPREGTYAHHLWLARQYEANI